MIFLTIGTQLPFDRLVKAVDDVAPSVPFPVFGQIGKSSYQPKNFKSKQSLTQSEFKDCFASADIIVAHAGIGTILAGLDFQKTLILMPREAALGEHRNDHQLATIAQLKKLDGIYEARDAAGLKRLLTEVPLAGMVAKKSASTDSLISAIRRELGPNYHS